MAEKGWLDLTYASWFLVEQRAATTPLQRTRFWLVLFSSAHVVPAADRHRCFSAKSASGDRPYASLADSSQGLAWWCWMQAFVACGLSNPTCASWSQSQLEKGCHRCFSVREWQGGRNRCSCHFWLSLRYSGAVLITFIFISVVIIIKIIIVIVAVVVIDWGRIYLGDEGPKQPLTYTTLDIKQWTRTPLSLNISQESPWDDRTGWLGVKH